MGSYGRLIASNREARRRVIVRREQRNAFHPVHASVHGHTYSVVDILKNGIEASSETYPHDNRGNTRVVASHDDSVTRHDARNIAASLLHRTEEVWPDTVLDGMTLSLERSADSSMAFTYIKCTCTASCGLRAHPGISK